MANIYEIHRETRDNLGKQDENKNLILMGVFNENLVVEEGPTILQIDSVGSSFVLGLATNAILGTTELGMASDYEADVVNRVVNPNNIFHEHFRFSDFNDASKTTGTFSTTYYNVSMSNGQLFQTADTFKDLKSIQYATIYPDLTGARDVVAVDSSGGQLITLIEGQ